MATAGRRDLEQDYAQSGIGELDKILEQIGMVGLVPTSWPDRTP
jgi:hypothetical protein